jgi:broad specificity phosphatase PhoE
MDPAEQTSEATPAPGPVAGGGTPWPSRPRLVVVRHGATQWSRSRRHTGRTDVPLLDEGRAQAAELGARLVGHAFARVLTSPLRRAVDTSVIAGFGEQAEVCDDLREWDYGAYEGLTTDDIRAERPHWSLWADGVPEGESAHDVGARADRVVAMARACHGDVLAFAHSHLLRVLGARWVGLAPTAGALLVLSPATLSVLGWEREQPVVTRWNDAAGDALA